MNYISISHYQERECNREKWSFDICVKKRLHTYSCTIIEISKTFTIKPNNLIFILPKVFYYCGAYVRLPIYLNIFTKP